MWTKRVVLPSPCLDQDLSLPQCVEDLEVEQLVTKLAVEALVVAVLPGGAGLDIEGLHPNPRLPVSYGDGRELRTIIRSYVVRWTT